VQDLVNRADKSKTRVFTILVLDEGFKSPKLEANPRSGVD